MQQNKSGSYVRVDAREFTATISRNRQENAGYRRNVSSRMLRRPYPCVLPSVSSPLHTTEPANIEGVRTYHGKGSHPVLWSGSDAELVKITIRCISNGLNYCGIFMGKRGIRLRTYLMTQRNDRIPQTEGWTCRILRRIRFGRVYGPEAGARARTHAHAHTHTHALDYGKIHNL
jgi:hypothetical protein